MTRAALAAPALAACQHAREPVPPPPAPVTAPPTRAAESPAPPAAVAAPAPAPSFERLEYVATYGGMPAASAGLVIAGDGAATLRFDGNRDSPLFPRLPSATRSGQVSAERRRALDAVLATAAITGPAPLLSTVGPTATGRVTLTRDGAPVVVEFPLYDPTPRWLPLRDALDAVVAELLDGVTR